MKILVVTGSSGGHIFPALAFLEACKEKRADAKMLLVLPRTKIQLNSGHLGVRIEYLPISPIKPRLNLQNLAALFNFARGILQSIFILFDFRPDVVAGFGSLASIPLVFFAWLFRIGTLIHEQNVSPGRANRFLAIFADKVAVSFVKSKEYFRGCQKRIVLTGNPLRKEIARIDKQKALGFLGLAKDKFTILVMGGSQGSQRVNRAFLGAVMALPNKTKLQVIHLSGENGFDFLKQAYQNSGVEVKLFRFFEKMSYAYSASDLILSRAGAGTISEIIFFGLPAVLIPYPYAYKHQLMNAEVLENNGSAFIIDERELGAAKLRALLGLLINNPDKLEDMRFLYRNLSSSGAAELLREAAFSLAAYQVNEKGCS